MGVTFVIYYINLDNIIFPKNLDYLNTNKVQELISKGEIDFSEKYTNEKYTINIYKIQDIGKPKILSF